MNRFTLRDVLRQRQVLVACVLAALFLMGGACPCRAQTKSCCSYRQVPETRTRVVVEYVYETVYVRGRPVIVARPVYKTVAYTVMVWRLVCDCAA